ncbi:MAG TPA: flagellar brake protein [bacterium]|nr:flagellar brake protein [bacterium]
MTDKAIFDDSSLGNPSEADFNMNDVPPFNVGMQVFLDLVQRNKPVRATAQVFGWRPPTHLMTSYPELQGRMVMVSEDAQVIVRFIHEGKIFGFPATIVAKQQSPFPMWTLAHRPIADGKSLRRTPRRRVIVPVIDESGGEHVTVDISAHGMLLATRQNKTLGDNLTLSFSLPDGMEIKNLRAEIVRIQQSRDASLMAVNYNAGQAEALEKISHFLYRTDAKEPHVGEGALLNRQ